MPEFKGKMPSLEDAHQYNKKGSWSFGAEDRFSTTERRDTVTAAAHEIQRKCLATLPRTRNLELLILKCHITIEYAIETYIRAISAGNADDYVEQFKFDEKLKIAFMLGLGVKDPLLIPSIRLLNRIRNDIAHRLTLNEKDLDELIRINSEQYIEKRTFSDSERLNGLKSITYGTCGLIAGLREVRVFAETADRER